MQEKRTEAELEAFRERRRIQAALAQENSKPEPVGVVGWRCPVCGRGLSPLATHCHCVESPPMVELNSSNEFDDAWQKVIDWYRGDDSGASDAEIVELVLADLLERDELVARQITIDNENVDLISKNRELQTKVEGLKGASLEHGPSALLLAKMRALAKLLGFEAPPDADAMADVAAQAKVQIGMQRDELRAMRAHSQSVEKELKTSQSVATMHRDESRRFQEKIRKLESEIESKRGLIEKLGSEKAPDFQDAFAVANR